MRSRDYFLSRTFHDPIHYPYGLEKSGDFSIRQCMLLSSHGALCKALMEGDVIDPSDSDLRLVEVANGAQSPETDLERVWLKYWTRTRKSARIPSMIMASGMSAQEIPSEISDDLSDISL